MTGGHILCAGKPVPFRAGESVASALVRAGMRSLGTGLTGLPGGVFCGIGQCQGCLVRHRGRWVEACLLPCAEGLEIALGQGDGGIGGCDG